MPSSQFDIVARLQLRADQFSSETGARFAELSTRARTAANDVRSSFGQSFAEVQKLAEQSLQLPRTAGGALDLSAEIAGLRQSAAAADQKAAVARELGAAMLAASSSAHAVTEAMRLEADAAMVAARGEEADATAIRQRILALEAVQAELNKTASATVQHTRAANDNRVSAEQQRHSTIMLGQQLQDFSVQVVSGQSVATAFSQQIGQASFALQNMGGKLAGVAAFLTTGWGIAATVGLTVLAPLVAKILDHKNALEDAVDKLKKDAEQTAITAKAHDAFAKSIEGQIAAQRSLNEELNKALQTQQQIEQSKLSDARKSLGGLQGSRPGALDELAKARAQLEEIKRQIDNPMLGSDGSEVTGLMIAASRAEARITAAKTRLRELDVSIQTSQESIRAAEIPIAERDVANSLDASKAAVDRYTAALGRLRQERAQGKISLDQFKTSLRREEELRDAAVKAEQERKSAAGRKPTRDPDTATPASIARLLRDALPGVRITSTTGGQHVSGSDHYRGAALDFVPKDGVGAIGKDDVRAIFERAGVGIRRNAGGVEQLFGPGDKGHSDHFHVAWEKGKLAVDDYRASVRETSKAESEAAKQQAELAASLDRILGKLDPAADAARKYRDELAQIDALAAAGKITPDQQFDYVRAAKRDYSDAQKGRSEQLLRDTFGDGQIDAALASFDAGIDSAIDTLQQGVDQAGESFGDALRSAVGSAMDLLGVRVSGPLRMLLQPGGIQGQANDIARTLTDGLKNSSLKISQESIDRISSTLGSAIAGAAYGQVGGSVFASITGGRQSQLGSALGGVLGNEAGKAIGGTISKAVGGTLGKTLGGAAGPLGALAGGIVGSVIGGLFRKTVKGSAGLSTDGGTLAAGSASGSNATVKGQAATLAGSVAAGLQSIADQLGAQITGSSNVQIGVYKDKLRVSTNGTPIGGKHSVGAQTFTDESAAIKYAIEDALQDGVLSGISAASLKILKSGQDLDKALSKALMIESVPKDLKAILDPVGAAIDELNAKFQKTVAALKEGGATAEQMAQAQQLYDLQLAQVKASTASASQGLKDFLASLKLGADSPYSLRDQEATAKSALAPFLAQIAAGQSIDQGKYQSAAQAFLDVERQLYGSTQAYFDQLDAVQAATGKAIGTIDNAKPIGGTVDSPFVKATADSTAATAAAVKTANEMAQDTNALLARLVAAAEANGGSINAGGFIGADRLFA